MDLDMAIMFAKVLGGMLFVLAIMFVFTILTPHIAKFIMSHFKINPARVNQNNNISPDKTEDEP